MMKTQEKTYLKYEELKDRVIDLVDELEEQGEILEDADKIASCIERNNSLTTDVTDEELKELILEESTEIERGSYLMFKYWEDYHDYCDEAVECELNDFITRYFDWEQYHRDCDYDASEHGDYIFLAY